MASRPLPRGERRSGGALQVAQRAGEGVVAGGRIEGRAGCGGGLQLALDLAAETIEQRRGVEAGERGEAVQGDGEVHSRERVRRPFDPWTGSRLSAGKRGAAAQVGSS